MRSGISLFRFKIAWVALHQILQSVLLGHQSRTTQVYHECTEFLQRLSSVVYMFIEITFECCTLIVDLVCTLILLLQSS